MKTITVLIALLISSLCSAQENELVQFLLFPNDLVKIGEKSVKFKEVLSDSRCPTGATCVWAGEAKVLLEIMDKNGNFQEKVVTISNAQQQLSSILDQPKIHFNSSYLKPYPSIKGKILPQEYSLMIGFSVEN